MYRRDGARLWPCVGALALEAGQQPGCGDGRDGKGLGTGREGDTHWAGTVGLRYWGGGGGIGRYGVVAAGGVVVVNAAAVWVNASLHFDCNRRRRR